MNIRETLGTLSAMAGPSGFEHPVAEQAAELMRPFLDEANVERMAKYLQNYSGSTQFIVITHRRKTMEAANTLLGVTMEEKGVSRLLSVKVDELLKEGT